jgi:hypothetical protein
LLGVGWCVVGVESGPHCLAAHANAGKVQLQWAPHRWNGDSWGTGKLPHLEWAGCSGVCMGEGEEEVGVTKLHVDGGQIEGGGGAEALTHKRLHASACRRGRCWGARCLGLPCTGRLLRFLGGGCLQAPFGTGALATTGHTRTTQHHTAPHGSFTYANTCMFRRGARTAHGGGWGGGWAYDGEAVDSGPARRTGAVAGPALGDTARVEGGLGRALNADTAQGGGRAGDDPRTNSK